MAELAVWQIYVMEYACLKDHPWVDFISGMYHDGTTNFPFSFVLAQCGDRKVLVDTGFMQEDHRSDFSLKFGIPTWISPERMLREMKLAPEAITDIVITHAHFDHMGSSRIPEGSHLYPEERASFLVRSLRASAPFRSSHHNRRPRQYPLGAGRLDRPSRDACRRRQERRAARHSRPAGKRTHDRSPICGDRDGRWPSRYLRRLRVLSAPVHRPQQ